VAIVYFDQVATWGPIDLPVSVEGLTITVGAGEFNCAGTPFELSEDTEYEVEPRGVKFGVSGYLARSRSSGDVVVLVDEVSAGEPVYDSSDPAAPYELMILLFTAIIPPEVSSLDNVEVRVTRVRRVEDVEDQP
jgi:hypothetical protein